MMKWVFCTLILLSIVFAIIGGDVASVSEAALAESGNAVTLAISLAGVICLWSGVMRIAQKAGLTEFLAAAFRPILSRLFRGINAKGKAMQYIVLNLTANLLGLGNASTPFGIAAMKELEKEEQTGEFASNNMILFVVMNTASLQIIPTTVAALRLKNGSSDPMEILPAVWIVSGITLTITIVITIILSKITGRGKRKS
ncbi:MAG: spore maturation protein A [Oscillospiraceae bacterium]|nr:spore maturation protein A [Oscillospiraceae bacterium]